MPGPPTPAAATVAAALKTQGSRLQALATKLEGLGEKPTPSAIAKEIDEITTALRRAIAPPPPSATTEKAAWPRDLADEHERELDWGRDPEGLHG